MPRRKAANGSPPSIPGSIRPRVFLDSGAYGAWTHGVVIPINDYIAFCREVKDQVWLYANLDVIPGHISRVRTNEDVAASAKASYSNLQKMLDAGLDPLPVFHQGEHHSWFERMLKDGHRYIGISTAKNQPDQVQERWLDEFFTWITNKDGRPFVDIHGFGSARAELLLRLPFKSVDSAGWVIAPAYGKTYIPRYVNGEPDYSQQPLMVTMSGNMQTGKAAQSLQFENLGENQQESVRRFCEDIVGCHVGMVRYDPYWRQRVMATYYMEVARSVGEVRFREHRSNLISHAPKLPKGLTPVRHNGFDFVFATAYDIYQRECLLACGAANHLISYYDIRKRPHAIEAYITGEMKSGKSTSTQFPMRYGNRRYRDFRARALLKRVINDARETPQGA